MDDVDARLSTQVFEELPNAPRVFAVETQGTELTETAGPRFLQDEGRHSREPGCEGRTVALRREHLRRDAAIWRMKAHAISPSPCGR